MNSRVDVFSGSKKAYMFNWRSLHSSCQRLFKKPGPPTIVDATIVKMCTLFDIIQDCELHCNLFVIEDIFQAFFDSRKQALVIL